MGYFGWMGVGGGTWGVYGALFWVGRGEWGYVGHCFRWVGVSEALFWMGGDEWGWVHCLIMPVYFYKHYY